MTKTELKEKLNEGKYLEDLFNLTSGQECLIYKGEFEISDNIIYIPDVWLNGLCTKSAIEDIETIIEHCYTGKDIVEECRGHEDLAEKLFEFVDWQHPNIQDLLEIYDEDEFEKEYGCSMEELF